MHRSWNVAPARRSRDAPIGGGDLPDRALAYGLIGRRIAPVPEPVMHGRAIAASAGPLVQTESESCEPSPAGGGAQASAHILMHVAPHSGDDPRGTRGCAADGQIAGDLDRLHGHGRDAGAIATWKVEETAGQAEQLSGCLPASISHTGVRQGAQRSWRGKSVRGGSGAAAQEPAQASRRRSRRRRRDAAHWRRIPGAGSARFKPRAWACSPIQRRAALQQRKPVCIPAYFRRGCWLLRDTDCVR